MLRRSSLCLSLLVLMQPAPLPAASLREDVRTWRQAHEPAVVRELADLVALPSLASDSIAIRANARAVKAMLERRGVRAEIWDDGPWAPAVFGELRTPGATRTLVFYAHYDGQPVTPAEWATPPYQPTLRVREAGNWRTVPLPEAGNASRLDPEARLFGRAAADDKVSIVAMLAALDALRASHRKPGVNLKFFFEGEEEAGSTHLAAILERHRAALAAEAWLFCDGPVHPSRKPVVVFGGRGVMGLELTAYGPARALHSGNYGNWAPNPALELSRALASMRDDDGRILVDGYYDDVRPMSDSDRAAIAALPDVDKALREELLLGRTEAGGAPTAERILQPALNVRGLRSGAVGAEASNAIPIEARASIDLRLVPDQRPERVRELVEAHLVKQGWFVTHEPPTAATRLAHPRVLEVEWEGGYAAYRLPLDAPLARAVRAALDETLESPVLALPALGGSLPLSTFDRIFGVPLVVLPIANHDDAQHAKDENLRLQNLWDGIEIHAAIMAGIAKHWDR
jgi:acetylornithine deacetylase/succinyl-diaminopimelate desuccinylase-like protein